MNIYLDPLSNSLFVTSLLTVVVLITGSICFFIARSFNDPEGVIKASVMVVFGILALFSFAVTGCQTAGCSPGSESDGMHGLVAQRLETEHVKAENELLRSRIELIEIEEKISAAKEKIEMLAAKE